MHEQLYSDEKIAVFLTIEDDDMMRVEIVSKDDALDLSVPDEVVVAVDGQALKIAAEDPAHVVAQLGRADELEERSFTLMLRVYEFFEGWDFGPDLD